MGQKYYSPPGPFVQKINTLVHTEPISTIVYSIWWCVFLAFWTPIAIVWLQVSALARLTFHLIWGQRGIEIKRNHQLAVLITGCDSGIGKELALWAEDAGFVVFAGCLQESSMTKFGDIFPNLIPLKLDVTSDEDVAKAVKKVFAWLKDAPRSTNDVGDSVETVEKRSFHALVNNAGIGYGGEVDWTDLSKFQHSIDVNYIGQVRCIKGFLPILKQQAISGNYKNARILNVTSMAGLATGGSTGLSAYHASKFAAQAFSNCLRHEMAAFGIQVATINPSFHETPLVANMSDTCEQRWRELSEETRIEYGQAFFDSFRFYAADVPRMNTWKVDNVVRSILEQLKARHIPPEVLIGMDARFVIPITRMVPAWTLDIIRRMQVRPLPAAMKK